MHCKSAFLMIAIPLFLSPLGTFAQDVTSADRVEEDWQLIIATPDVDLICPQITTSMQPSPGDQAPLMLFNLNHRDHPQFSPGGLQVQARDGDQVTATSSQGSSLLQTNDESITWTQRMSLAGGNLNFKILSGNSTTWGSFGDTDTDLAVSSASSLTTLGAYSPDTSVAISTVGFGSNRVSKLTLVRVRYYQGNTLLSTDSTSRSVDLK